MSNSRSNIHFEISERKILLRIIDILVVLGALYLVGIIFDFYYFQISTHFYVWPILLALYLTLFATIFEMYNLQKASRTQTTLQNGILTTSVTAGLYLLTPILTPPLPDNRIQILIFFGAMTFALLFWRFLYIKAFASHRFNKNILIIADAFDVSQIADAIQEADPNFIIVGFVNTDTYTENKDIIENVQEFSLSDAKTLLDDNKISEIVVATSNVDGITSELYQQLIDMLESGFPIREYTQVYEEITNRVPVQYVGKDFYKYFPFSRSNNNKLYLILHRMLDLSLSILGLFFGIFIIPIILIGNLIGNRGPLFYTQKRVGKNGKPFNIIKLRSMVTNAEAAGAQWAQANDARITKFGKFLRKSRFDEIPQFVNVLKGEMSIIGPRPERPVFVKELSQIIPFYETRHVVKPGVTGWAQVRTAYGSTYADSLVKLQYDLYYIKHRSIFLDIRIVIKTLSTIIFFRGQ